MMLDRVSLGLPGDTPNRDRGLQHARVTNTKRVIDELDNYSDSQSSLDSDFEL